MSNGSALMLTLCYMLQVSNGLMNRVSQANSNYNKDMEMRPRVSPFFELSLDNRAVLHEIDTMNFFKLRGNLLLPIHQAKHPPVLT